MNRVVVLSKNRQCLQLGWFQNLDSLTPWEGRSLIPEFVDGVLPEGIYACTLDEVESVFGQFRENRIRDRY